MWKRNLLFFAICLAGAASLAGALLRRDRLDQPLAFNPARLQQEELGDIVGRVDAEFRSHWEMNQLQHAPPADRLTIARRLALGLTGTIPSLEEVRHLETLPAQQQGEWYVSRLLEDRRYADYVAERLARAYVGTEEGPFIVYRRRRFVRWLSDQLYENVPYDHLVRQLISATGIWTSSPEVNFLTVTIDQENGSRPDPLRLASRTARAMLGMRIDCLQCHDDNLGNIELGTVDEPRGGTQEDFHRLAAFYSEPHVSLLGISDQDSEYQYQFLDAEQEETVPPLPPFGGELLTKDGNRRERVARWVTHRDNKPFARAIVNRVWALMFGRPLVEPIDDIPLYGKLPPALDILATDFAQHGFDIQRLIRVIAATEVFQLSSRADFEITPKHERNWLVFPLTRLRPEQVAGATIQSASLKTIDAHSHIVFRLTRFGDENEFVKRYGDSGEDEFEDRGGTVTQRLLMMNGKLVKEKTREKPLINAATRIAHLAPDNESAVETAYLCALSRRPSETERRHFVERLGDALDQRRNAGLEDIFWTLLNSTEFSGITRARKGLLMGEADYRPICSTDLHFNRRTLLKAAGIAGASWLTPLAAQLARAEENSPRGDRARSVIVLWLQGGPSQLETFDPHPGTKIAAGTEAIGTSADGIQLAKGLEQVAAEMQSISIVRSVVSKEGDHERTTYNMKTGFRPDPTLIHPALGSVICHQLPNAVEIPRHVSIFPGQWPARGGYLGDQFDAFKMGDPQGRIPDVEPRTNKVRSQRRIADLDVVEAEFVRGRLKDLDSKKTLHRASIAAALNMMESAQLKAFDVNEASDRLRQEYGDTEFGRGCLTAVRLIEVGVRCVEVTLGGWDSHLDNQETQAERVAVLDPAFAALIRDLRRRELLEHTVVLCGGEFGRTPDQNPAGGRDHWPHGFSVALAGGGLRGGQTVGQTSPDPTMEEGEYEKNVVDPKSVADLHATVLQALGIDFSQELVTPVGRPMVLSRGHVIDELLTSSPS